jgi:membrane fusion protein, heavy metal efflux system
MRLTLIIAVIILAIGLWQFATIDEAALLTGEQQPIATDAPASSKAVADAKAAVSEHQHADDENKPDGAQPAQDADQSGEGHEEEAVKLSAAQLKEFGIELDVAGRGSIAVNLDRPAEIKFDGDRLNHVGPRVDGMVIEINATQGQNVEKDDLLAVLNSRELAELKAAYLGDLERRTLARENFDREKRLWEKRISSEKDYLAVKTASAEAEIAFRSSAQKLRALGVAEEYIASLTNSDATDLTRYEIRAPIAGTVIQRHLSLGETVSADNEVFVIADASAVWIEVTIYPKDMDRVRAGQKVWIDLGEGDQVEGEIAFVTPHVSEETRTATARVIIDSANGRLKPGMFVKAAIEVAQEAADVRIPKSAIQLYENAPVVFVQDGERFEPRQIRLGRQNGQFVEVASGVSAGETYVAKGAFTLKAELEKASFGDGHAH